MPAKLSTNKRPTLRVLHCHPEGGTTEGSFETAEKAPKIPLEYV